MEPPLAKSHLDELAFVAGSSESDGELQGWVSDTCFRALVISLLGLIARSYPFDVSKVFLVQDTPIEKKNTNSAFTLVL